MPRTPIAHPIKAVLASRGITQVALAEATNTSLIYLNRMVNGHIRPSARFRRVTSAYLGLPESALFHLPPLHRCPTCRCGMPADTQAEPEQVAS